VRGFLQRPHIILFTVDDMGWNDVGYQSSDLTKATPFMNSLAETGVKLTHYYSQPSCTPSRVAMMTGKFPYANGFQNYELQVQNNVGVPMSNRLLPNYLQAFGYKTVCARSAERQSIRSVRMSARALL